MTTASAQVCGGHVATAAHTTSTTRMRALAGAFGCRAARLHDAILALTSLVALPTLRINFVCKIRANSANFSVGGLHPRARNCHIREDLLSRRSQLPSLN